MPRAEAALWRWLGLPPCPTGDPTFDHHVALFGESVALHAHLSPPCRAAVLAVVLRGGGVRDGRVWCPGHEADGVAAVARAASLLRYLDARPEQALAWKAAHDPSPRARLAALEALVARAPQAPTTLSLARDAARHARGRLRLAGLAAVPPPDRPGLATVLVADPVERTPIRSQALALGLSGLGEGGSGPRPTPLLRAALEGPRPLRRRALAWLAGPHGHRGWPALAERLDPASPPTWRDDPRSWWWAGRAVARHGPPGARRRLVACLAAHPPRPWSSERVPPPGDEDSAVLGALTLDETHGHLHLVDPAVDGEATAAPTAAPMTPGDPHDAPRSSAAPG